jgi:hypothetical protein
VTAYRNLGEAATADSRILDILLSDQEHTAAREDISALGFETSEMSVRRWRAARRIDADAGLAPDEELAEDVGTGMDLDGPESHVEEGWDGFKGSDRDAIHSRLDAALDAVAASPEDVTGLRVSTYQTITKDAEGEAHKHDLYAVKLLVRTKEIAPEWPVVQQAAPTEIFPVASTRHRRVRDSVAVILPDPQIGYRQYEDGTLDPFHDERALDVAMQVLRDVQPDRVIWLGDFLDLPEFGRFAQESSFARTTQAGIDRGHQLLAQARAVAPDATHEVLEGNHDRRLQNMVTANASAAFGLRQANSPSSWPVLSVPYLLRLDELEVIYVGGYPAGQLWLNEGLRCIHGTKVRSGGSTAAAVVKDDHVSTIFGHIHRVETQHITRQDYRGGKTLVAHSPGCLCRIDGAVPSAKGSTTLDGRPVESYENWQQGLSVVHFDPSSRSFAIDSLFIDTMGGHTLRYGGNTYTPNS